MMHTRTTVKFSTEEVAVNIQKARRSMNSLMPVGLHGENGLDPQTVVHIFLSIQTACIAVRFGSGGAIQGEP